MRTTIQSGYLRSRMAELARPETRASGEPLGRWAESRIRLEGKPFAFRGHAYLRAIYDDTAPRIARNLWPNPESVRSILDQIAIDDPRAKQLSERDHWDLTLLDEIQQSGFLEKLYKQ